MIFQCQVCTATSSGIHFGADVCRACSAFFRRSVSTSPDYMCKKNEQCEITKNARTMCKKCRFEKCLTVGMRKNAVQKHRDLNGKRRISISQNLPSPPTPFLSKIGEMYEQLQLHRISAYSSLQPPRFVNYKQNIQVLFKEFYLISDWIHSCFNCYAQLPTDQKDILLRNFYFQFITLESGFKSCHNRRNDVWFMPSGDFIDCVNLKDFFVDPDEIQPISSEQAAEMFASSFDAYHRNVSIPMMRDVVDFVEFMTLATLALFASGLDGQSNDCYENCRKIREYVQKEIIHYYKSIKNAEEAPIRMGRILSFLPNLERSARRFQEDIELRRVLNAFPVDANFYDNCLVKF